MKCGKSNKEIKEAKAAGCVIHGGDNDYITADQGSIQYPLNGNSYTNFEKCIWQIRPKTANKFLKVSLTRSGPTNGQNKRMANFCIWPFADLDFSISVNGHGHSPLSTIIKARMVKQDLLRIRARINLKLGLGHF